MSVNETITRIVGAKLLSFGQEKASRLVDISIAGSNISGITPHDVRTLEAVQKPDVLDARGCLVGPSLCHAHVHLDKCFLLNDPKYSDLEIVQGTFAEALELTSEAKQRFAEDDLLRCFNNVNTVSRSILKMISHIHRRGRWLIEESINAGVTVMRVFVEVDVHVKLKCLNAAIKLKHQYKDNCYLKICAFAQDPIFSTAAGDQNRSLLTTAVQNPAIEVVGTTPYVEDNESAVLDNLAWALQISLEHDKHLDFHLDYNLSPTIKSYLPALLELAEPTRWNRSHPAATTKRIALAHCTRLTLFGPRKLKLLLEKASDMLPISLIGLPTSDLYMMGRPEKDALMAQERPRGTLQIPSLLESIPSLRGAIAINNVGNAFTPQGNCDPLSIASLGVGLYHAGSKEDTKVLYQCVSSRAKEAIGVTDVRGGEEVTENGVADLVIFGRPVVRGEAGRRAGSMQEVVCDPPRERRTISQGRLVAG